MFGSSPRAPADAHAAPRKLTDGRGRDIDLRPLGDLVDRILKRWQPLQIRLFGSRSRGDATAASDWDVLAIVPDEVADEELAPLVCWALRKESGVRADIIALHASEYAEDRETPNTVPYEAAREGVVLYER